MAETLPLAHIKVIDLTSARSGPSAVRQFADWGADVIMVEAPDGPNDVTGIRHSSDFQNLHRNKRSIALDLKDPDDKAKFLKLVESADVLFENYRPDVKFRLGIDYATLSRINPRLVYGSISGFGEDGPYRERPGYDQIAQGMGGLMSITGIAGQGPVRAGIAVTDVASGLYCALGAMMALVERERTGKGRWIRTSLLEAQIGLLDFQAARWLIDGKVPPQEGNHHPSAVPMGLFETADGHVNVAAAGQKMFTKFCRLTGREALLDDPRFATFQSCYENRDILREIFAEIMLTRTSDEWIRACNEAGIPCGPVHSIDAVFSDPQVRHLRVTRQVQSPALGELEILWQPITVDGIDFEVRRPAPEHGEHGDEILASW
jgi:crotonobetainyl-CoA:carnitine CoA-transferase CaiB-like acyl-CoA transferase